MTRLTLHDVINTKEQPELKPIKDTFEGEYMQTQYSVLGLIFIFISTRLQQKLMNSNMLTEILVMKLNDKKHQKKNLIVSLLELTPLKKISTFSKK